MAHNGSSTLGMPSDSPVIITDGSNEIYSVNDDYSKTDDFTYTVDKANPAMGIKLFGIDPETSIPAGTAWTVCLKERCGTVVVAISSDGTNNTLTLSSRDGNPFKHVTKDLSLKHPGKFEQSELTVGGGSPIGPGGGVRIRFRDPKNDLQHVRKPAFQAPEE